MLNSLAPLGSGGNLRVGDVVCAVIAARTEQRGGCRYSQLMVYFQVVLVCFLERIMFAGGEAAEEARDDGGGRVVSQQRSRQFQIAS